MRLPSPPIRRHLCACASRLYTPRMPCRNSQFVLRFVPDLALSDECRARPRVVLVFDPGQGAADTSEIVPRHALSRSLARRPHLGCTCPRLSLSAVRRPSLGYPLAISSAISTIYRLPLSYISSTSRLPLGYILATSRLQLVRSHRQADTTRPRWPSSHDSESSRNLLSRPPFPQLSAGRAPPLRHLRHRSAAARRCGCRGRAAAAGGRENRDGRQMWPVWPINIAGMAEMAEI